MEAILSAVLVFFLGVFAAIAFCMFLALIIMPVGIIWENLWTIGERVIQNRR